MGVTVYTKVGCPYCAAAKADLKERDVEYEEIDVHATPGAMEKLAELTGGQMVVPVLIEDGDIRVGFGGG
jgi:glutaredoxin